MFITMGVISFFLTLIIFHRWQTLLDKDLEGAVAIPEKEPEDSSSSSSVRKAVVDNIQWLMAKDRKVTALKQFQGHMWRSGYQEKKVVGE